MIRAAVGLSTNPDTTRAALEAGSRVAEQLGRPADWCIAFATEHHEQDLETMQQALAGTTDTPYVVGCSAAGVVAAGREIQEGPALGLLGVASDQLRATPFLFQDEGDQGMGAGVRLGQRFQNSRGNGDVVLAWPDPFAVRPDMLLRGVDALLGHVPIIGGAASANGGGTSTFQFCGAEFGPRSVSGLRLGGSFGHRVGVTQGCRPLCKPLRVTGAHENLILEIEGRPALDVLRDHAPEGSLDDLEWAFHFLFVGILPREPQLDRRDDEYVVRNIVAQDVDSGVIGISDRVSEGQYLIFAHREPKSAREDLRRMLQEIAPKPGSEYRFGLYFNCLARGRSLYREEGVDAAMIAEAFPDVPVLGFFCNAELGPMGGENQLFTYTGVLAMFSE